MWHFIGTNRLGKYAGIEGIRESLDIMVRYKHINISPEIAVEYLSEHEERLYAAFKPFFREVQDYCDGFIYAKDRSAYLSLNINGT